MREEYHVTLYSQMGPREGRLVLQYEGSAVTGSLELMGRRNPVHGVRSEDGHLCLSHAIRTAVSTLFCETALELHGERLTGVTTADVCRMRWEGSRICMAATCSAGTNTSAGCDGRGAGSPLSRDGTGIAGRS